MENRIILKNFQYSYSVGRNTFMDYEKEYYNSLSVFLEEYEDNTEALYLQYIIPEWNDLLAEFKSMVELIKSGDNEVFYFVRNRIRPDGSPPVEDSKEVKSIVDKLDVTIEIEERNFLYGELAEIWRRENEEEENSFKTSNFPNWREVENVQLEKSNCIRLLERNIATGFLFINFLNERQTEVKIVFPQVGQKQSRLIYTTKPCFKPKSIDRIITTLNDFFDATEHVELRRIIETGSNTNEKLLFKDNGNKLTDCFRELFNNKAITGCTKTVLINWIIDNFNFTNGSSKKDYSFATVEKVISSKYRLCKNPII